MMADNNKFDQYKDLINERAWHWARKTGVSYEELAGAGAEVFVRCVLKFDATKGAAFSTYLHCSLNNRFQDICSKEMRYAELGEGLLAQLVAPDYSHIKRIIEDLGEDARWLARQIVNGTAPLVMLNDGSVSPKKSRGAIRRWLRGECGWSNPQVYAAFHELEHAIK